jgi:hypothetical protein
MRATKSEDIDLTAVEDRRGSGVDHGQVFVRKRLIDVGDFLFAELAEQ